MCSIWDAICTQHTNVTHSAYLVITSNRLEFIHIALLTAHIVTNDPYVNVAPPTDSINMTSRPVWSESVEASTIEVANEKRMCDWFPSDARVTIKV